MRGLMAALLCAAVLGSASAFGDWLWSNYLTDGALLPAVVHGVLIFLLIAVTLGCSAQVAAGAPVSLACRRLVPTLPLAGFAIAGLFYPLASVVGYIAALLVSWCAMWVVIALLQRWACRGRESSRRALVRAAVAALGSGLAFWAISGIWTAPTTEPVNYLVRFLFWTFAFLPGFSALLVGHRATGAS